MRLVYRGRVSTEKCTEKCTEKWGSLTAFYGRTEKTWLTSSADHADSCSCSCSPSPSCPPSVCLADVLTMRALYIQSTLAEVLTIRSTHRAAARSAARCRAPKTRLLSAGLTMRTAISLRFVCSLCALLTIRCTSTFALLTTRYREPPGP